MWIHRRCSDSARPIAVDGLPAATLSLEDMLFHTYTHMLYEQVRLVSVADMVSIAERYVHEIDWGGIQRRYPHVLAALELFHFLTPLSGELLQVARLQPSQPPKGTGEQMQGWPNNAILRWRAYGLGRFLKYTFFPSEWWLRLAYGLGAPLDPVDKMAATPLADRLLGCPAPALQANLNLFPITSSQFLNIALLSLA